MALSDISRAGSPSSDSPSIEVCVKLFAIYQDILGTPELHLRLPTGTTASEVLDHVIENHPELAGWRSVTRFGINLQFAEPATLLRSGDEVVLIPPVSGG